MSLINISHSDKNKIDLSYMDKIMKRFRRRCDIIEMSLLIDKYVKNWRPRYVDNENGIFNIGFPFLTRYSTISEVKYY